MSPDSHRVQCELEIRGIEQRVPILQFETKCARALCICICMRRDRQKSGKRKRARSHGQRIVNCRSSRRVWSTTGERQGTINITPLEPGSVAPIPIIVQSVVMRM